MSHRLTRLPPSPPQKKAVANSLAGLTKALGGDGAALAESLKKSLASKVVVTENGKPVPGFAFMSAADAAAKVTARRNELHARYVKLWAKRVLAMPEQALVPKRERDALLASKFEVRAAAWISARRLRHTPGPLHASIVPRPPRSRNPSARPLHPPINPPGRV
jgi:hypothetical protein